MGGTFPDKSRREKQIEAGASKKLGLYEAWLQHQKSQKVQKVSGAQKRVHVKESTKSLPSSSTRKTDVPLEDQNLDNLDVPREDGVANDSSKDEVSASLKIRKVKKNVKKRPKTKFEEYLQKDMQLMDISAEEDLKLEKRLAKKLKLKSGKLGGIDDNLNKLFKGVPSILENVGESDTKSHNKKSLGKKRRRPELDHTSDGAPEDVQNRASNQEAVSDDRTDKMKKEMSDGSNSNFAEHMITSSVGTAVQEVPAKAPAPVASIKYVPPHLRVRAGSEPEEHSKVRRRVRGLLNRLSESNVESITGEVAMIYRSLPRIVGSQILSEEVLASCAEGPRGNEQYAAVFAAFIAGVACSVGVDFSAKLMASLAKYFEDEYLKEDNLSLRNLTLLLSNLCMFGVCSSDLIYDFLITLSQRLTEIDVSTILCILQCCGMKIRSDDPTAMKNFIISVQNKVNELKASPENGENNINGKRMEFMLETIFDIKNNKKRTKEDSVPHTRIKKWLQKLRAEDILIRGMKWSMLLDPNKKGQWWLSGDAASANDNVAEVASTIDKEVLEAQKMLELASSQSMNTDARRAIFCVIMSGEDYVDAFEKLLRLDLPGKQDRDIIRVLVECCLQEKVFNKYYTILASKLCEHDKNHKFTLQFCIWDHFKKLDEMHLQRSMHLAKFIAELVTSFTLSLTVLKAIDFSNPQQLTPKRVMHFRMLFESLFEHPESLIWNIFSRVAVLPELEPLRYGMEFFVKEYVLQSNQEFAAKFKVMKKALINVEGVLM